MIFRFPTTNRNPLFADLCYRVLTFRWVTFKICQTEITIIDIVLRFSPKSGSHKSEEMIKIFSIYWPQWNGKSRAATVGYPIFFSIFGFNLKINLIAFSHCRRYFLSLFLWVENTENAAKAIRIIFPTELHFVIVAEWGLNDSLALMDWCYIRITSNPRVCRIPYRNRVGSWSKYHFL